MTVDQFFSLFLKELEQNKNLQHYYKFLENQQRFEFRKAYFCQRLEYILQSLPDKNARILDCGCGYGTTGIFLALNGYKVEGLTLEFYHQEIASRMKYWAQHGDVSGFTAVYENIFDVSYPPQTFDYIILQDTLHHLEPLDQALAILKRILKVGGRIVLIEENGNNIVQNLKLIKQRGFKKVKTIYDEKLGKSILLGDENIRSLAAWKKACAKHKLAIDTHSVQYIRYYYPGKYAKLDAKQLVEREQILWKKNAFLKQYFFFGLNFVLINIQ